MFVSCNRREFLGGLALAAGAASLGGCRTSAFDGAFARTVFISDIHAGPGHYELERFQRVVDEILAMSPRPGNVVCCGDIAYHHGLLEDYVASRPEFERLIAAGIRVTFGMGNHDRRRNFLKVWPEYRERMLMKDYVVSETDLGPCDLLMVDTLCEPDDPAKDSQGIVDGAFTQDRVNWLSDCVSARTRPFILAGHHSLGEIAYGDKGALEYIVTHVPLCIGWIHGHDHCWKTGSAFGFRRWLSLASTGTWGDIGYAVADLSDRAMRVTYRALDHYFPNPDHRTPLEDDVVAEKQGHYMTFRW